MTEQDKDKEAVAKAKPNEPSASAEVTSSSDQPVVDGSSSGADKSAAPPSPPAAARHREQSSKKKKKQTTTPATTKGGRNEAGVRPSAAVSRQPRSAPPAALWLALLALLLGGAAVAASYWLWQQGESDHSARQQQLDAMQAEFTSTQKQLASAAQQQQEQWQAFQQQQGQQLEAIRQQLSQSRDPNWLLAEAEYLVRMANHRLQLAADVDTAISALSLADQRLQALRDPRLLLVRRQLAADLGRLKAVARIDVTGMALTLSTLQQQLQQLPLQGRMTVSEMAESTLSAADSSNTVVATKDSLQFLSDIWASLRALVTIRRVDDQSVAVVPVTQRAFLYQNLALKLEAARLALLRQDDGLYHQSLATAQAWLERYFDQQDSAVRSLQASLQQLGAVKLDRELPVATASLQAIQALRVKKPLASQVVETKKKATPMPGRATVVDGKSVSSQIKETVIKAEDPGAEPTPSTDKAVIDSTEGHVGEKP